MRNKRLLINGIEIKKDGINLTRYDKKCNTREYQELLYEILESYLSRIDSNFVIEKTNYDNCYVIIDTVESKNIAVLSDDGLSLLIGDYMRSKCYYEIIRIMEYHNFHSLDYMLCDTFGPNDDIINPEG